MPKEEKHLSKSGRKAPKVESQASSQEKAGQGRFESCDK